MPSSTKIAVLDVETTGLDPRSDRIIQFACLILKADYSTVKLFESYINPGKDAIKILKTGSFLVHKISPDRLENEPCFEQKAEEIFSVLKDVDLIVGHNIGFDWDFLRYEFARLDETSTTHEEDTDESWNDMKKAESIDIRKTGHWKDKFNKMKFQLADTYRLALLAYQNETSHSLSNLSRRFQIHVRKCQTVSYKWRRQFDFEESELKMEEKFDRMPAHNAITDVLSTAEIFKDCLKILKIQLSDLVCCKFPEFMVNKLLITEAENLLQGSPSDEDLQKLAKIAPSHMNVNHPDRGFKLKDMKENRIQMVIDFLLRKNFLRERRQALICRGFKLLVSTKDELVPGEEMDPKNTHDMTYGLRFDAEKAKSPDGRSPLKDKMREFRLSDGTPKKASGSDESAMDVCDHATAAKISKVSQDSEKQGQIKAEEFEAVIPDSEIIISSGDLKQIQSHGTDNDARTPPKEIQELLLSAEELVSPVFDKSTVASQESASQSILGNECQINTSESESQVFPVLNPVNKTPPEEKSKARKKLLMSPDY